MLKEESTERGVTYIGYKCNVDCCLCYYKFEPKFLRSLKDIKIDIIKQVKLYGLKYTDITGGEPTIQPDLPKFTRILKEKGYRVKLDSNGLLPETLEKCLPHLDYVAVDVKTSPQHYPELRAKSIEGLLKTIRILKRGPVEHEFRCTTVPGFVDEETVPKMGEMVEGARRFTFQQFIPGDTLDPSFSTKTPFSREQITQLADIMTSYVEEVTLKV